jgi:CHAT domain-containing protein/tetratricopeptide (TPR) repeat protein
MSGKVFFTHFSFLLIFSFKVYLPVPVLLQKILREYAKAERLYNSSNNSIGTDSASMQGFKNVVEALTNLPRQKATDSLMFQASYRLGILYEIHEDYPRATAIYLNAYHYAMNNEEKFRMQVFTGTGYYYQNNFDSASFFLLRAAENAGDSVAVPDQVRLFNTLGVLYYDNGNYLQGKNYFSRALLLIEKNKTSDLLGIASLQLNMATCFYKLGNYEQALGIYKKVLGNHLVSDPLYINMGRAYAGLHQYDSALTSFKKVKIRELPGVLNDMARTAMDEGIYDSARCWLNRFHQANKKWHTNLLDEGVNELYTGELDLLREEPASALSHFQNALIIFSGSFTEKDVRKNPANFTGSFAYYRLFEVLNKKASGWELSFKQTKHPEDLLSALDTYQSTISLLSYIEKSYETDDAKLLLKKRSGEIFTHAMDVCLQLNDLYPKRQFLNEAFLIAEKNKASVMNSQIRERHILNSVAPENALSGEERNIKYNIARLNAKVDEAKDEKSLKNINDLKSDFEIQLVNIRHKMEANKRFYQLKFADDFPSIVQLQNSMGENQALISFYSEPEKIQVFVLTKSSLGHVKLDNAPAIFRIMQDWIKILQTSENGAHPDTKKLRSNLYEALIKPIIGLAGNKEDWTIIPDGLFFQLPLESLPGRPDGGFILEDHTVSYEFSAQSILDNNTDPSDRNAGFSVLSFAPFSQKAVEINKDGSLWLEKLAFSKDEINGLPGTRYFDHRATKSAFMNNINRYPFIHLATHAFTDLENPSASFIAFFPSESYKTDDFLFLDEIYSLNLDSCHMIVISACETGRGAMVRNEGVMSFARAFLYAGCPSVVSTLWKADDRSTDELLKLFYKYLEAGNSKAKALQKAKIEFIRNNPLSRDPAFWSHIVLTGNQGAVCKKKQPWLWAVFGITFSVIIFFLISIKSRRKVFIPQS